MTILQLKSIYSTDINDCDTHLQSYNGYSDSYDD